MRTHTKQISALALALSLGLVASAANAANYTNLDTSSLDSNGFAFSQYYNSGDTFTDTYQFTVSPSSFAEVALTYITNNINVTSFSISGVTTTTSGSPGTYTLDSVSPLSTGTYDVIVQGSALSSNSAYNVSLTLSPVPEPAESALMLSGIAMLGFIASRRKAS